MIAIATQYDGYVSEHAGAGWDWVASADRWARPLGAGVLVGLVPWLLLAPPPRHSRLAWSVTAVAVGVLVITAAAGDPQPLELAATWLVAVSATAALALLGGRWWRSRAGGDLFFGWLFAGSLAAWVALVPGSLGFAEWRQPDGCRGRRCCCWRRCPCSSPGRSSGRSARCRRAVSPDLARRRRVDGARRRHPRRLHGGRRRGRPAVGGSGPTWLLVGASGVIALST